MSNFSASRLIRISMAICVASSLLWLSTAACPGQVARKKDAPRIRTFDDLMKSVGIKNPNERKYIEDSIKQNLQDKISDKVDLGFDVEVYLKTIDHLVHGEIKQANEYLIKEAAKKLVEKLFGSSLAAPVLLAWDFAEYSWTSTQKWAEERDKQTFHDWMYSQVMKWRTDRDLYQIKDARATRIAFNLWWSDNQHRFGKTKMAKDREVYLLKFENECRHRMMDVAEKHRSHYQQQESLRRMAEIQLKDLQRQAWIAQLNFNRASRKIKYAEVDGDIVELVQKYFEDEKFEKEVLRLIAEKNERLKEEAEKVQSEYSDIVEEVTEKSEDRKGNVLNIPVPLEKLETLVAELESILAAAQVSLEGTDEAYTQWRVNSKTIVKACASASLEYGQRKNRPGLSKSERSQLEAEIRKISEALGRYNQRIDDINRRYHENAYSVVKPIWDVQVELQQLMKTAGYDLEESVQFQKDWSEEYFKIEYENAKRILGPAPGLYPGDDAFKGKKEEEIDYIKRTASLTQLTPMQWRSYILQFENGEPALDRVINFYSQVIDEKTNAWEKWEDKGDTYTDQYESRAADIESKLQTFVSWYKANQSMIEFSNWFGGRFRPRENEEIKSRPSIESATRMRDLASQWKDRYQIYWIVPASLLESMEESQFDFEMVARKDRQLLSTANLVLLEIKRLHGLYANQGKPKKGAEPLPADLVNGLPGNLLNSSATAGMYTEMIRKYNMAQGMLNGSPSGYQQAFSRGDNLRLDRAPYEFRRYPLKTMREIRDGMKDLLDHQQAIVDMDSERNRIMGLCSKNRTHISAAEKNSMLLRHQISKIVELAGKLCAEIEDANRPGSRVFWNQDQARQTYASFQAYVQAAHRLKRNDDQRVQGLINQTKSLTQQLPADYNAKVQKLKMARSQLELAENHLMFVRAFAPYAPTKQFDGHLEHLRKHIDKLAATTVKPVTFQRRGNFFLSLNDASYGPGSEYRQHSIKSRNGELVIQTQHVDRMFQNAKEVQLRLTPAGNQPGQFITVSRGTANFKLQRRIQFGQSYRLELRVIDANNQGFEPLPFPFSFVWNKRTGVQGGGFATNVKTIRVNRPGEVVQFSAPLNKAMELKITQGNLNAPSVVHVIRTYNRPIQTQYGMVPAWQYYAVLGNRWIDLTPYQSHPAASRKLMPADTEEDSSQQVWDFIANIQPREQYNVYLRVDGGPFQLAYYVIGRAVTRPKQVGNQTGGGQGGKGDQIGQGNQDGRPDKKPPRRPNDVQAAYESYIAAYNKLTSLMAAGKGNTPEAQAAYQEYLKAKLHYEERMKNSNSGGKQRDH